MGQGRVGEEGRQTVRKPAPRPLGPWARSARRRGGRCAVSAAGPSPGASCWEQIFNGKNLRKRAGRPLRLPPGPPARTAARERLDPRRFRRANAARAARIF